MLIVSTLSAGSWDEGVVLGVVESDVGAGEAVGEVDWEVGA